MNIADADTGISTW